MTLIGFKIANENVEWPLLRDLWKLADATDAYDIGWNFDHLYPIYGELDEPCLEGWTMLAALAEATDRVRLGCLVGATPYRAPAVLAKMASTIDIVSEGRLELGLGAGWHVAEAEAYDLVLPPKLGDRFDLFDEACEIIIGLLRDEVTTFAGEHFTINDAFLAPKGPQTPPPVTIGGTGPTRTLRAVARFADWWNTPFWSPDDYTAKADILAEHCATIGRDPSTIRHSTHVFVLADQSVDEIADSLGAVIAAGVDQPIAYFQPPFGPEPMERAAEAIATLGVDHQ
jgi:alkanesulfonate monooxygenase SsuD/methylene tetrahydromethanopterin reductase-like flavin-dependent oxidoreductase (luciferase family)